MENLSDILRHPVKLKRRIAPIYHLVPTYPVEILVLEDVESVPRKIYIETNRELLIIHCNNSNKLFFKMKRLLVRCHLERTNVF